MQLETTWERATYDISDGTVLGLEPLRWLSAGRIAVVCLRGLLGEKELDTARRQAHDLLGLASTVNYTNGSLATVGPYLAAHLQDPHEYFDVATRANERMAHAGFDLPARVRAALRRTFGLAALGPASGPDGRPYGEAVIRLHADGVRTPLHNDHIARDATGTAWAVADVVGQLSCIVCLQECDWGGELVTYRKPWESRDERWKVPGELCYRSEVVATVPRHVFRPQTQDVYLIDPTYYHEIEKAHGAIRTTLGFFIGFTDDTLNRAVAWG
ncbi:2OG-Fe(II)-dependent halogenase WelO5 family protein [Streptomyces sp. NBC_00453]|uniref:2OG-Fe(II)-dependent halogenase WelO5 family protein n=1 Tax=Streptomyces sp. NBC_00453 TaxID=2903653 RepID=UPI002E23A36A